MCRFVAYHGPPVRLDELLYKPEHSLIHQSVHSHERSEPLNGDGWGVGWYDRDLEDHPGLYRTVTPAWSDENMRHMARLIETPLYFAHVRAASPGLAVQQLNCHPFVGGEHTHADPDEMAPVDRARHELLFMHNGNVGSYRAVIRRLREELPEDLYFSVRGSTDSEHAFAVVQRELGDAVLDPSLDDLADAMRDGLAYLERLKHECDGAGDRTQANLCLSDGERIVATRYAAPADVPAQSLYVGQAGAFVSGGEYCTAERPEGDDATLIASERLFDDDRVWTAVPRDHMVTVDADGTVAMEPLDLDVPAP